MAALLDVLWGMLYSSCQLQLCDAFHIGYTINYHCVDLKRTKQKYTAIYIKKFNIYLIVSYGLYLHECKIQYYIHSITIYVSTVYILQWFVIS